MNLNQDPIMAIRRGLGMLHNAGMPVVDHDLEVRINESSVSLTYTISPLPDGRFRVRCNKMPAAHTHPLIDGGSGTISMRLL